MSKSQKKRELSVALKAIRDQMAQPGITAEDRQDLQSELLELEQEAYDLEHPPVAEEDQVSERDKAIKLCEDLEAKGDDASVAQAKSIRESIMQTEFKDAEKVEEHDKFAQRGHDQLEANKLKVKEDQAKRDQERADAEAFELKKVS